MIWRVTYYKYSTEHRCTSPIYKIYIQADSKEEAKRILRENEKDEQICITTVMESSTEEVLKESILNYNV